MSENRFKRAREQVDFVHDINSDTPKTEVVEQRSHNKQGRNIYVPLYMEELEIIEYNKKKVSLQQEISVSNFIRQTLLNRCQDILGQAEYERLNTLKRNVVKK